MTFDGRRYRTASADLEPKPAHRIPIWLGTFGNRAIRVTGRLADGWIPSHGHAPLDQVKAMGERVLAAGPDPAEITCAFHMPARVDDRAKAGPSLVAGRIATGRRALLDPVIGGAQRCGHRARRVWVLKDNWRARRFCRQPGCSQTVRRRIIRIQPSRS